MWWRKQEWRKKHVVHKIFGWKVKEREHVQIYAEMGVSIKMYITENVGNK